MKNKLLMLACGIMAMSNAYAKETITIATVNNGDMITMKELSNEFTSQNPDIDLNLAMAPVRSIAEKRVFVIESCC